MLMSFDQLPPDRSEAARSALASAFGRVPDATLTRVPGGASGALAFKVSADGRDWLLRMADPAKEALRNPYQYAWMQAAADAGVAPTLRYADASAGVAIMDFIAQRPLAEFPGGPAALAAAMGRLLAKLQALAGPAGAFTYRGLIARLLGVLRTSGRVAPGLLDPHAEAFERICAAYPWDDEARLASHNDPNPHNILFDGERLWLIDWETAFPNDPLVDVAIVAKGPTMTAPLEDALLTAWLGREPDADVRARLALMKPLTRLYYGVLLLALTPDPVDDLLAPSIEAFQAALASGRLAIGSPQLLQVLGKMALADFLAAAADAPALDALARFA
jgi:Ser/Thr protein kinase RdoA (MazF antagonist)